MIKESSKLPTDTAKFELRRAFQIWAEGSDFKLKFVELENDKTSDINIGFYVGDHGCGVREAFDGPNNKLAHAFQPPIGDIHFDDDEDWDGKKKAGISLFWTAIHEIGHSLGFRHTHDSQSIMTPFYENREGRFKLPDVDRAGLRFLYGDQVIPNTEPPNVPETKSKDEERKPNRHEEDKENEIPEKANEPCNTNIDAIASIRGDIFIFKNDVSFYFPTFSITKN